MTERDSAKKSMVFYYDWFDNFDDLNLEEVTDLLNAIRVYAQYGEHIDGINRVSERILKTMESRIDADFENWKQKADVNRENGQKGGRPRKSEEQSKEKEKPNGFTENPQKPNGLNKNPLGASSPHNNPVAPVYEYVTDYDNDYDNDTVTVNENGDEKETVAGKGVQGENLTSHEFYEKYKHQFGNPEILSAFARLKAAEMAEIEKEKEI